MYVQPLIPALCKPCSIIWTISSHRSSLRLKEKQIGKYLFWTLLPVVKTTVDSPLRSIVNLPTLNDPSFHSHHPVAHKRAVVKSLTDRAKTIPSSSDQRSKEMKRVTAALVANGYPKRFVIDVGKPKRLAQQLSTIAPDAAKGSCILPYIKGTSEPIKRVLSNQNIKVAQKPHQTIGNSFSKPKDPVPKDQTRGAIYSIPSKDCDKSYIGETKRKFSTRLNALIIGFPGGWPSGHPRGFGLTIKQKPTRSPGNRA